MHVIGIDLGGTKIASAIFSTEGRNIHKSYVELEQQRGAAVGKLIQQELKQLLNFAASQNLSIKSIGISVPGIYYSDTGHVWAPNIPDWEDYPLLTEMQALAAAAGIEVRIDSDRACYILGETWLGTAQGCRNAIFMAVGTGIGAGILIDGKILRGQHDIAGAIGWLALDRPYRAEYKNFGCYEYQASGDGIARMAREFLQQMPGVGEILRAKASATITARDVFAAYENNDPIAQHVLQNCIELWGMTVANLVSLFNPEKIIFGGGVFGPAGQFLPQIFTEARRWAQPISIQQVELTVSSLGGNAGLIGAGRLAMLG
ncbi:ROK family protein [candidate division KSB1 bacterium]|nr:ROK family protein [candidate division KSB1 bacterium]